MTSRSDARSSPFSLPSMRVGVANESFPVTSASGPSDTRTSFQAPLPSIGFVSVTFAPSPARRPERHGMPPRGHRDPPPAQGSSFGRDPPRADSAGETYTPRAAARDSGRPRPAPFDVDPSVAADPEPAPRREGREYRDDGRSCKSRRATRARRSFRGT